MSLLNLWIFLGCGLVAWLALYCRLQLKRHAIGRPWQKKALVVIAMVAGWNAVFWETLPSITYHAYMCNTWAGPVVYQQAQDVEGFSFKWPFPNVSISAGESPYWYTAKISSGSSGETTGKTFDWYDQDNKFLDRVYVSKDASDPNFQRLPAIRYHIQRLPNEKNVAAASCYTYAIFDTHTSQRLGELRDCVSSMKIGHSFDVVALLKEIPLGRGSCFSQSKAPQYETVQATYMRFILDVLQPIDKQKHVPPAGWRAP